MADNNDAGTSTDPGEQQQNQNASQASHSEASWDSLKTAWETAGLTPAQISGRLEASRKWEQRAKSAPSAEELQQLREKAQRQEALEDELASDKEKAVKEARTTAEREKDERYQPLLAQTAFKIAIGDRKTDEEVTEFLADLNLKNFINEDGTVNTAKVLTRAEQFAPATGTKQQQRGPIVNGLPAAGGATSQAGSDARAYMQQRFGKTDATK